MRDSTGSARYMIPTPVVKPQAARPDLFSCVQDMQLTCVSESERAAAGASATDLGTALVGRAASCLKQSLRRGLCVPCRVLLSRCHLEQEPAFTDHQEEPLLSTRGDEAVAAEAQFCF